MDAFEDDFHTHCPNYSRLASKVLNGITESIIDELTIYATVDLVIDNDIVINFNPVSKLPEFPHQ